RRRILHELNPGRQRRLRSRQAEALGLVEADPHAAYDRRRVTDEVRVLVVLRGAGLAGRRKIQPQAARARAGSIAQYGFESARDQVGDGRTNDAILFVGVLVNLTALRIDDRLDGVRRRLQTLGRKNLVRRGELEQG